MLPEGYFAEPNAQFGTEIDVATYPEGNLSDCFYQSGTSPEWMPRSPTATLPFQPITDVVEVQVFSVQAGPTLVGAIELVSPANKDRPAHRNAFTSKCQTYLQQGIGLIVVDVVTTLSSNLHNELMHRLELPMEPMEAHLYAIAYRVAGVDEMSRLNIWQESFVVGDELPTLPLYLKGGLYLPIDLAQTYRYTCVRQRIPEMS
jgi:hypothetical protein